MRIVKLTIAYLGKDYNGWQIQPEYPHVKTIQNELQKALRFLTKEDIKVLGAGRTDAGVSAIGQVASFYTNSSIPHDRYPIALKGILPEDIVVYKGEDVDHDFHPIKDANGKWYRYHIYTGGFSHVFYNKMSYHIPHELDIEKMSEAASLLQGEHDFRSFCVVKSSKKDFVRNIKKCQITIHKNFVIIDIYGDGFLHNMVRIIAGTLIMIGKGKLSPQDISGIIDARDRSMAGPTAPAKGLCLVRVDYKIEKNLFCNVESLDMPLLFY